MGVSLDVRTANSLFQKYTAAARQHRHRGGITLLITHRFSTAAAADCIVVLDRDRVVETRTHEQLLTDHGHYAELYEIQSRGF
jgi:ATP-binding cassette, subfamily B, bacterial